MSVKILGIDPGSQVTGFGVIEKIKRKEYYVTSGCILIGKLEWPMRLKQIYDGLSKIIHQYSPQIVAIEKIFVHKNVSSALKLGQVRGVAMLVASLNSLDVFEYTPREIKKTVVGYGGADKNQVQQMMKVLLQLDGLPKPDAADALAVAYCHSQRESFSKSLFNVAG